MKTSLVSVSLEIPAPLKGESSGKIGPFNVGYISWLEAAVDTPGYVDPGSTVIHSCKGQTVQS